MQEKQMKAIIGGIFGTGTYTQWDEEGNAHVKKEKFNIRLYKDLWYSGAIQKLKGNRLGVFLTIAIHADNSGEGWPNQETIASMLGINRVTVVRVLKKLEEDGFIEREKTRYNGGQFDNTVYKIKFAPDLKNDPPKRQRKKSERPSNNHVAKSNMVETVENQHFDHVAKSNMQKATRKKQHAKSNSKDDLSFKNDPFFEDNPSFKVESSSNHSEGDKTLDNLISQNGNPEKNYDDDYKYIKLRNLFVVAKSGDIKKHEIHYPKFEQALKDVGGDLDKLILYAKEYIMQKKEASQIAWFLGGGWKNYQASSNKKYQQNQKPSSNLPAAQEEYNEQVATNEMEQVPQDWAENQKKLAEKMALWEKKKQRKREQIKAAGDQVTKDKDEQEEQDYLDFDTLFEQAKAGKVI